MVSNASNSASRTNSIMADSAIVYKLVSAICQLAVSVTGPFIIIDWDALVPL